MTVSFLFIFLCVLLLNFSAHVICAICNWFILVGIYRQYTETRCFHVANTGGPFLCLCTATIPASVQLDVCLNDCDSFIRLIIRPLTEEWLNCVAYYAAAIDYSFWTYWIDEEDWMDVSDFLGPTQLECVKPCILKRRTIFYTYFSISIDFTNYVELRFKWSECFDYISSILNSNTHTHHAHIHTRVRKSFCFQNKMYLLFDKNYIQY